MIDGRLHRSHGRDARIPQQCQQSEAGLQHEVDDVEPEEVAFALRKDDHKAQLGDFSRADEADGESHHPAVARSVALQLDDEDHQKQQPRNG